MLNNVHSDVIVEILVRLSVKSLCQFKCVSKLWYSLITDPRFVTRHVDLAIVDKDVEHKRRKLIFVLEEELEHVWGKLSLYSLYHVECKAMASNDTVALKLEHRLNRSLYVEVKFIGSFNGLVCLCYGQGSITVLNPAIKELKRIPKNSCLGVNYRRLWSIYGFGYDHSIDDYNVVEILHNCIVSVYSLKTNTWRRAQSFPYRIINCDPGVFLNGAVHWVFARNEDPLPLIVAFDFAKGDFRELPRLPSDAAYNVSGVGVLGGCLCCPTQNTIAAEDQQYVWVMKEYGVKESWTKAFVIDLSLMNLRPLSYLKHDEALFESHGSLIVYNPREQFTRRKVEIRGIRGRILEIGTYVESLISPNHV